MMIGNIKGYDICNITTRSIKKEELLSEIKTEDSEIKEEIITVLKNKGYICGLKKKGILKAIYLFEHIQEHNKKILKYNKSLYVEDTKDKKEQFEKIIIEELKEKVNWGEFSKVIWNDMEIEPNESQGFSGLTFSICISLGVIYGIVFDNLAIGLLFGVAIGSCFGAVVKKKK